MDKFQKYQLVSKLAVVINHYFPDFYQKISQLPDYRKRPQYSVKELIVSGLLMFLFQQKTRNNTDTRAKNIDYQNNILKLFKIKVADMDTVDKYLRFLDPMKLEALKQEMFKHLIKSKVLHKHKFLGKYFMLTVDGTGLQTFKYEPYPGCPFKTHKNGTKTWTAYVLEAKIVTSTGFSFSLGTEWVENPQDENFDKQDNELKAFKRLAKRIKKTFPRLPLALLLDGLYPNAPVFKIANEYGWKFIITLKDDSLKSVQEQISDKSLFNDYESQTEISANSTHWITDNYRIYKDIQYKEHKLFVVETKTIKKHKKNGVEVENRFVHITNIQSDKQNVDKISQAGRMRWKIENEGFNVQKKHYNIEHKFSRNNFNATKNYYQLLQIAHIINQLMYNLQKIKEIIKDFGLTVKSLIEKILSMLNEYEFSDVQLITSILSKRQQLRY